MTKVKVYTDGGCLGTPGTGGWAFIISEPGLPDFEGYGGLKCTTNNRMEITAVLQALRCLRDREIEVQIYSDSQYVVNSINQWVDGWARKNFFEKKNADLWREYLTLRATVTKVVANWVRGHNGHTQNERCDELAEIGMSMPDLLVDEVCHATYGGVERVTDFSKFKTKSAPKVFKKYKK